MKTMGDFGGFKCGFMEGELCERIDPEKLRESAIDDIKALNKTIRDMKDDDFNDEFELEMGVHKAVGKIEYIKRKFNIKDDEVR